MENEQNKGQDIFKDLGEGLSSFGQKLGKKFNEMVDSFSDDETGSSGEVHIKADVFETNSHYVIELELPGVNKEDVKISAMDDVLKVKGQKTRPVDFMPTQSHIKERRFGTFIRTFELPSTGIQMESIKAKFANGLLLIEFPKTKPDVADVTEIDIERE